MGHWSNHLVSYPYEQSMSCEEGQSRHLNCWVADTTTHRFWPLPSCLSSLEDNAMTNCCFIPRPLWSLLLPLEQHWPTDCRCHKNQDIIREYCLLVTSFNYHQSSEVVNFCIYTTGIFHVGAPFVDIPENQSHKICFPPKSIQALSFEQLLSNRILHLCQFLPWLSSTLPSSSLSWTAMGWWHHPALAIGLPLWDRRGLMSPRRGNHLPSIVLIVWIVMIRELKLVY